MVLSHNVMEVVVMAELNKGIEERFHPDHLADLRKSGLSDETIFAAGIKTIPPRDIAKRVGL